MSYSSSEEEVSMEKLGRYLNDATYQLQILREGRTGEAGRKMDRIWGQLNRAMVTVYRIGAGHYDSSD